ncbi:MAG: FKBP-type peptidyl-prolyl cis-trans isomerase, partial [Bacteroidales bacterium]|nr:FKBP-type peptidyl-prolyl cis-trans isomerase [Bacteroidales bacterium]
METIKPGKYVELVYQVKAVDANGNTFTMEFTEQRPDKFVYGVEQGLIEKFEKSLLGMEQGAEIALVMTPEETS